MDIAPRRGSREKTHDCEERATMGRIPWMMLVLLVTIGLGGCDLVGDVLEFGFWTLLIVVVVVVALVVWIFKKLF